MGLKKPLEFETDHLSLYLIEFESGYTLVIKPKRLNRLRLAFFRKDLAEIDIRKA